MSKPPPADKDWHGWDAFRAALNRQEGAFHRAATVILNDDKDLTNNPLPRVPAGKALHGSKQTDNERIASAVMGRSANGQFVKKGDDNAK